MYKVLVIGDGVPVEDKMLGLFPFDQAKALSSNGVKVVYFGVDLRSIRRKRRLGYGTGVLDGVEWHSLAFPIGKLPSSIFDFIGTKCLQWLYNRVFGDGCGPDVIHSHFVSMSILTYPLAKKHNLPLIITEHSSSLNSEVVSKQLIERAKPAFKSAAEVIAVSTCLADRIKLFFNVNAVVIPNIIDVKVFSDVNKEPHQFFNIVSVARLSPEKRINLLINCMENLKSENGYHLHIIGDGSLKNDLEELVNEKRLRNVVTFHGKLTREKIAKLYSTMDCFSLFSKRETFGVVYLEAIAAGLPVIATKCGGPEDFITKETGLFVNENNDEQVLAAFRYLHDNLYRYNREEMRNFVISRYSPAAITERIIKVYNSVIDFERREKK